MIIPLNTPLKFAHGVLDVISNAKEGDELTLNYFVVRQDSWGLRLLACLRQAVRRGVHCTLIIDSWGSLQPAGHGTEYDSLPLSLEILRHLEKEGLQICIYHHVENINMFSFKNIRNWDNFSRRNHNKNFLFNLKSRSKSGLVIGDSQWTDGHFGELFRGNNVYIEDQKTYRHALEYVLRIKNSRHVISPSQVKSLPNPRSGDVQSLDRFAYTDHLELENCPWYQPLYRIFPDDIKFVASEIEFDRPQSRHTIQHHEIELMQKAQHDIWYVTPYFCPDHELLREFICAQQREHVQLNILIAKFRNHPFMPYGTQRAAQNLSRHEINIFEYKGSGNIHYKDLIVDDISFIKTANGDGRSRFYNLETGVIIKSMEYAILNRNNILSDIRRSERLTQTDSLISDEDRFTRLWKNSLRPLYYKHL